MRKQILLSLAVLLVAVLPSLAQDEEVEVTSFINAAFPDSGAEATPEVE